MISQEKIDELAADFRGMVSARFGVSEDVIDFMPPKLRPDHGCGRGVISMSGFHEASGRGCGRFFYADTGEIFTV